MARIFVYGSAVEAKMAGSLYEFRGRRMAEFRVPAALVRALLPADQAAAFLRGQCIVRELCKTGSGERRLLASARRHGMDLQRDPLPQVYALQVPE